MLRFIGMLLLDSDFANDEDDNTEEKCTGLELGVRDIAGGRGGKSVEVVACVVARSGFTERWGDRWRGSAAEVEVEVDEGAGVVMMAFLCKSEICSARSVRFWSGLGRISRLLD
jgi:hypothetical protein